ncbi:MAG TPA: hypothetical protein ENO22_05835 [candidate division Zixibacteria bacterium]|nr:hypothetical protein [candidate division Zixibacteria bacterium]
MTVNISGEEVMVYLAELKIKRRHYYEDEILTQNLIPPQVNRVHNERVTDLNSIDNTIAMVNFFNEREKRRTRIENNKKEPVPNEP